MGRWPRGSRAPARGRPAVFGKKDPTLTAELPQLIEPETGGDPAGKRKYVRLSLRCLARQLGRVGHVTGGRWLKKLKSR